MFDLMDDPEITKQVAYIMDNKLIDPLEKISMLKEGAFKDKLRIGATFGNKVQTGTRRKPRGPAGVYTLLVEEQIKTRQATEVREELIEMWDRLALTDDLRGTIWNEMQPKKSQCECKVSTQEVMGAASASLGNGCDESGDPSANVK
eukprot:7710649-Pyramimonas_sp.AAC.2